MENVRTVAVWGDSVMRGVIYDEEKKKYVLLSENGVDKASRALGLYVRNRSRMGCTVTKGMQILKKDLQGDIRSDAALIEFGGNDCDYDWAQIAAKPEQDHQPKTPLAVFSSQLRDMVQLVAQKGIRPMLLTLPPIHAQRYFDFFTRSGLNRRNILQWLGDIQHIYRWHERYNNAIIRVAIESECQLIDIREAFLDQKKYEEYLCVDGIHPNEKGHSLIDSVLEGVGLRLRRNGVIAG